MSGQRSDVGFIELDLNDRPGERSTSFSDRPDGRRRAVFHDLFPDGSATRAGLLPDRVAKLQPWHRRTLRIALAMKGGLSLAVWIGGAVAELDILRRIRLFDDHGTCRAILLHKTDAKERSRGGADPNLIRRATEYAQLLRSRGYDRVEFDVLAGASAGGLNGVLYAVAQRAGVGFDTMLDTWLEAGSAWGLLQTGDPSRYDAVMRGDGYFWPQLSHEILKIVDGRDPVSPLRADQVVVDLSATLLDAVDSSDRTTAEGRAQFRFVGGRDALDDRAVPPRYTDPLDARDLADIVRIAYAARSTSSFPFIFEPALIYSGRDPLAGAHGWASPRDPCEALDAPDMRMVFNAHREDAATHPFRVADGGILDNIPIDRALNAVRNMPADEHSNRAILYLDPSPKESAALFRRPTAYASSRPTLLHTPRTDADSEPAFRTDTATVRDDVGSRVMSTIVAALRKRSARESRDDEIEEVDLVRATTSVAKARNELLAERFDGHSLDAEAEERAAAAYTGYRALSDFELLAPPLLHPGEWLLGTDLAQRPELLALDRLSIVHVEAAFRNAADRLHDPAAEDDDSRLARPIAHRSTARGRQSLVDASMAALSWIRAIEQTAFHDRVLGELDDAFDPSLAPDPIGDDDRRRHADREDPAIGALSAAAPRALARRKLSRVIREATLARDEAILVTLEGARDRMNAQRAGGTLSPHDADEVVKSWVAADARGGDRHGDAWEALDDIVAWLLRVSQSISRTKAKDRWLRTPWSRLESRPEQPLTARQLPLLFGGSGIPQPISSVRFHRIGSDVQPAQPLEYRLLMEDQLLRGYRSALAHRARELDAVTVGNLLDEQNLRSTAKLAGLRAANIAGFLSRDWRLNDWWWGRLDAASGIVEFFSSLPSAPELRPPSGNNAESPTAATGPTEADVLTRVHRELLAQLDAAPTAGAADPDADPTTEQLTLLSLPARSGVPHAQATRERFVRGTQGFDALSDSYRVAIASRTLRAASSALTHGERATSPKRFLHWLLRPIAVLLPAVISIPRLILLAGLLAASAVTVWPMNSKPELQEPGDTTVIAYVVTGVAVALIIIRLAAAIQSKRRHDRQILAHTTTRPWTRDVIAWSEWRARGGRVALVSSTVILAAGLVAVVTLFGMSEVLYWVMLIAFIAVGEAAAHALQTVPVTLSRRPARPIALAVLGAGAAIALTTLLTTPFASLDPVKLSWTSAPGWSALVWHVLGAAVIGAAIAATLVAGLTRDPLRSAMPIAWTGIATGLASAITALAFMQSAAMTGQVADLLIVGWAGGTALWWAPWWRGRQTGKDDGPKDTVVDRDWPDTRGPVPTRAHRRAMRIAARKDRRAQRAAAHEARRAVRGVEGSTQHDAPSAQGSPPPRATPDEAPEGTVEREAVTN